MLAYWPVEIAVSVSPVLPDWNWSYKVVELPCETTPYSAESPETPRIQT